MVNPNLTGMELLLNSTGSCVLSVTQWRVAFLLHKMGMSVRLVVLFSACACAVEALTGKGDMSQRAVRKTQKHLGLCVLFSNTYTHQILIEFESVVIWSIVFWNLKRKLGLITQKIVFLDTEIPFSAKNRPEKLFRRPKNQLFVKYDPPFFVKNGFIRD